MSSVLSNVNVEISIEDLQNLINGREARLLKSAESGRLPKATAHAIAEGFIQTGREAFARELFQAAGII